MSKFIQALLTGLFFTFILDGGLFIGVFINYIQHFDIPVYYNILFADNQCWLLFGVMTLFLGFVTIYLNRPKVAAIILGTLFSMASLALIPAIGQAVGSAMLMSEDETLMDDRYTYHGSIYYEGRSFYYFYDDELQKFITLDKKDLKK